MDAIAYAAHAFGGRGTQVERMHNLRSCQNVNFADMMSVGLSHTWSLSLCFPLSLYDAHFEFINHKTDGRTDTQSVAYLRLTRRTHFLNMATLVMLAAALDANKNSPKKVTVKATATAV